MTELSKQRLDKAIEILDKTQKILISGGYKSTYLPNAINFPISRSRLARKYLLTKLVSPKNIISWTEECRDTIFEAIVYYRKLKELKISSCLVISSEEHLPRVTYIYRNVFGNEFKTNFVLSDSNIIDKDEEADYLFLTKKFCPDLKKAGDFIGNFDDWYKNHPLLYTKFKEIHDKYHPKGKKSQAYAGVKE